MNLCASHGDDLATSFASVATRHMSRSAGSLKEWHMLARDHKDVEGTLTRNSVHCKDCHLCLCMPACNMT